MKLQVQTGGGDLISDLDQFIPGIHVLNADSATQDGGQVTSAVGVGHARLDDILQEGECLTRSVRPQIRFCPFRGDGGASQLLHGQLQIDVVHQIGVGFAIAKHLDLTGLAQLQKSAGGRFKLPPVGRSGQAAAFQHVHVVQIADGPDTERNGPGLPVVA